MKVTYVEPTPPPKSNVVIELTYEEARVLYTILGNGGPGRGCLPECSDLWAALRDVGVEFKPYDGQ